jgi:hypothetical protein
MMKKIRMSLVLGCLAMAGFASLTAQDAGSPLDLQGMNQSVPLGVRSRGMGGAVVASGNGASSLFANPALLSHVLSGEVRMAAYGAMSAQRQSQEWVPNRIYPGLSLLMEDKWAGIKDPDLSGLSADAAQWEKLQKPLDTIGPNWSRNKTRMLPMSISAAYPIAFDDFLLVAGFGAAQTIDLNHYFKNNNVLDPLIGSYRPQPMPVVAVGDTLHVRWYQFTRRRDGAVYAYTPALAIKSAGITLGFSASILNGSSDDFERRWDRGYLTFIYNRFKIDPLYYTSTSTGTSKYKGLGGVFGMLWDLERFSVGVSVTLPMTITRTYSGTISSDTTGSHVSVAYNGEEKLKLPLRYTVGVLLTPRAKWNISFDYGTSGFSDTEELLADGTTLKPWIGGNAFRLGTEFLPAGWLAIRAGFREEVQPFSPAGSAIIGEAAHASVTSAGAGVTIGMFIVDLAYEYSVLHYQDLWQSNINDNLYEQHRAFIEVGYRF